MYDYQGEIETLQLQLAPLKSGEEHHFTRRGSDPNWVDVTPELIRSIKGEIAILERYRPRPRA